jgi:hypothetical protein
VWYSKTNNDGGLKSLGSLFNFTQSGNKGIVTVKISSTSPRQQFNIEDLKPYDRRKNPRAIGPLCTLCDKLLVYSHNKIAVLSTDEADYLHNRFRGAEEQPEIGLGSMEGDPRLVSHFHRERKSKAIRLKKQQAPRPLRCEICEATFHQRYQYSDDLIECHHLSPLGSAGPRVTNQSDLILVCANCHRIIHSYLRKHPDAPKMTPTQLQQAILLPVAIGI